MTCPGCGVQLANQRLAAPDRYHASGECWQLFGELSGYTLASTDATFIHQLAVDAYGAQHSGGVTKPITTAFSLAGLYLTLERGYTGWQVQQAHLELAKQRKGWPLLPPPEQTADLNVLDVLLTDTDATREERLRAWATAVWAGWQPTHAWVRETFDPMLEQPYV